VIYFCITHHRLQRGWVWSAPIAAARDKVAYVPVRGSGMENPHMR
jgi:hypothetical protein